MPHHGRAVVELGRTIRDGAPLGIAATACSEVLVGPTRAGLVATVDRFLDDARIAVVPLDRALARAVADLRAQHPRLRVPDACTLSTAVAREEPVLTLYEPLGRLARAPRSR